MSNLLLVQDCLYNKRSDSSERYTGGSIRQMPDEPKRFGSDYNSEPA
jgi:hypothetical protein